MKKIKKILTILSITSLIMISQNISAANKKPLMIEEQGSFAVGGKVLQYPGKFDSSKADAAHPYKLYPPDGQTLHGDHAYVFYQKPVNMRKYPLIFLHGGGQSGRSWETTPDGREGFQNIFLRKNYGVYILDQPRRGRAGQGLVSGNIGVNYSEQYLFNFFRIGLYPEYFDNVQFSKNQETLNQYFRQVTPNTGDFDENIISDAVSGLFNKVGEGILVAHSQGSGPAMETVLKNSNVKGLVVYEPGGCNLFFPDNVEIGISEEELPDSLYIKRISSKEFKRLTAIPMIIYFGDNIPSEKSSQPILEEWRLRLNLVKRWAEIVNTQGGDVKVIHLPEIGIKGNTHFPFSDLNNEEIAGLMEKWLEEKGFNK